MRVALISHGTRGDIQPMAAVGALLRRRGHDVVLGVPANLVSFGQRLGFEVVPLAFDTAEILGSPRGQQALAGGNIYSLSKWIAQLHHQRSAELDADVRRACQGADIVVANFMLEERAAVIAESQGIPLVLVHSVPVRSSADMPNAMILTRNSRWRLLNRATHQLFSLVWWGRLRADTNVFRRAVGLPEESRPIARRTLAAGQADVQAYSRLLVPELEREWAGVPGRHFSGFVGLGPQERALLGEEADDGDLGAWLAAGDPPVYFGFGSTMLADPAAVVELISATCTAMGLRALIVAPQPEAHRAGGLDPARIRLATAVNHDRVLPQVAAAVHHGGAGTLAATLGAGRPTMICSFYADQPFWGARLEQLGVGHHHRFRDLDQAALERGLRRLLEPGTRARAAELGARLAAEPDGATIIADLVDILLAEVSLTG